MASSVRQRSREGCRKLRIAAAVPIAIVSIGTGAALAEGGGGVGAPRAPELTDVTCQNRCAGLREAATGARVQLTGRNLDYVDEVQFNQKGGGRIGAEAENVTPTAVEATVPDDAESGKPQVVAMGTAAESPVELKVVAETAAMSEGGGGVSDVAADPAKGFFMGKQATATFVAQGGSPQDVRVDVVSKSGGEVLRSLVAKGVEPGTPARVKWNGKTEGGGVAPNGEYDFEVKPMAGGNGDRVGFEQYDHIFPVRGKHEFWAGLGDGRGHQGVDVGAACGKRLVAARGGKVQAKAFHGAAGNYVVIDGKGTDVDYAYMHLQQPTKYKEGDKVKTGAGIGKVGETGNAQGCHLHFEMWKGGWYEGGKVMDPMPPLKHWDEWS